MVDLDRTGLDWALMEFAQPSCLMLKSRYIATYRRLSDGWTNSISRFLGHSPSQIYLIGLRYVSGMPTYTYPPSNAKC